MHLTSSSLQLSVVHSAKVHCNCALQQVTEMKLLIHFQLYTHRVTWGILDKLDICILQNNKIDDFILVFLLFGSFGNFEHFQFY